MKMKLGILLILIVGLTGAYISATDNTTVATTAAVAGAADAKEQIQSERVTIKVSGTFCAACMVGVRRSLERMDGVQKVDANETDLIVEYDPRRSPRPRWSKPLKNSGSGQLCDLRK